MARQDSPLATTPFGVTVLRYEDVSRLLRLAAQPDLAGAAVEETVRYSAATGGLPRVALEDIELHGVTIPAGDGG